MKDRTWYRLGDALDAIAQIGELLNGKAFSDLQCDRPLKAAFERFLEILSEASRHIPEDVKSAEPGIEWRRIADIGNHLRHAYHRVDAEILWRLHEDGKLSDLHVALTRIQGKLPVPDP
jgi:uncharacterized protein with HEPN domain